MSVFKPVLLALAMAMPIAAGCESDDDEIIRRDRDRDGITDRYDREDDRVISRERVRVRDRDLRGLDDIPRDAVRVEEGVDKTLRYEADRDGRIYVYDEDDDRVVYRGTLLRGEDFVMDPDDDVLSIEGKRLGDVNLRAKHRYRVYFMRE